MMYTNAHAMNIVITNIKSITNNKVEKIKLRGWGWRIINNARIDWNYFERVVLTDRMCCKCTVILIELIQKLKRAEHGPAGANETLVFTLTLIVREDDMKDE